jgi:hypothetical protein
MNDRYFYDNLMKKLEDREKSIVETLCFGSVIDYTAFKEMRARLSEISLTKQELKDLLQKVDDND